MNTNAMRAAVRGGVRDAARPRSATRSRFIRRVGAERFIEEVSGDDPEVAAELRVEERRARHFARP